MKTTAYRLVLELIPEALWGISAYRVFGKTKPWKEIRQDTLEEAGNVVRFMSPSFGLRRSPMTLTSWYLLHFHDMSYC